MLNGSASFFHTQKKPLVLINVKRKDARKLTCAVHAEQWVKLEYIACSVLLCNNFG